VAWVDSNASTLFEDFDRILPEAMADQKTEIWHQALSSFKELLLDVESQFRKYVKEYQGLIASKAAEILDMSLSSAQRGKAGYVAQRLTRELGSILSDGAIGFLSKRNLLPKYGFPVDTVNLTPRMDDHGGTAVDLSRDLALALFDYAPGSQVIANKQIWESVGISTVPGKDVEYKKFAQCYDCGRLTIQIAADEAKIAACAYCDSTTIGSTSKYMIPKWGFIAKLSESKNSSSLKRQSWNRDLFLAEPGKVDEENKPFVRGDKVTAELQNIAKMLVINNGGATSAGYNICQWCNAAIENVGVLPKKHEGPLKPSYECKGSWELRVKLGHLFETDLVRVRLEIESSSVFSTVDAADSIEQAIIQAASDLLQITRDDIYIVHLGFSPKHIEFAIVDAVPAGAGFAPMIGSRLQDVIEHALKIVERCNCGEETSCYQCLRTYSNQRIHEKLRRDLAIAGLSTLK
jgi:hypothetical protein